MQNDNLTEKKISSTEIYKGVLLHVFSDKVGLPNGNTSVREDIKHNGAVCVVPVTPEGEVYMVRQYRYPVGRVTLEVPAGKIDPGEEPLAAAARELSEETGLENAVFRPIGALLPSVAYTSEVIYMYLAEGFTDGRAHTDPDEFLNVEKIPLDKLTDMVMNGEIEDAKTQAAILKAAFIKRRNA